MAGSIILPGTEGDEEYILFGKILLHWGYVETRLTNILGYITHQSLKLKRHKGIPRNFDAQVKLAERGYREIPSMTAFYADAKVLLDAIIALHEKRVVLVHGSYQGRLGDSYIFTFFRTEKGFPQAVGIEEHRFSRADLVGLFHKIREITHKSVSKETDGYPFAAIALVLQGQGVSPYLPTTE